MPRKKVKANIKAKGKKATTVKRQSKSPGLMLAENIEKDFRYVPAKLAALYKKDLTALKVKEKKLLVDLKKAKTQKKTAKDKHSVLTTKSKTNSTAKKQLAPAKKLLEALNTTISKLAAELDQSKQHAKMLTHKQAKFTTLGRQLLKIEKEIDMKEKNANSIKARKKVVKKATPTHKQTLTTNEGKTQTEANPITVSNNELVELDS